MMNDREWYEAYFQRKREVQKVRITEDMRVLLSPCCASGICVDLLRPDEAVCGECGKQYDLADLGSS